MTKQISPAELAPGMFVTVLENKPFVSEFPALFGELCTQTVTTTDRSGMGEVHTILAVDLPFIVVRCEGWNLCTSYQRSIDTRRTSLMELAPDYVAALCPHLVQAKAK